MTQETLNLANSLQKQIADKKAVLRTVNCFTSVTRPTIEVNCEEDGKNWVATFPFDRINIPALKAELTTAIQAEIALLESDFNNLS